MPTSFAAGTTLKYERTFTQYPVSEGWQLDLYLAGASVAGPFTADSVGNLFAMTVPASATAGFTPGAYTWEERISRNVGGPDEEKYVADADIVTVLASAVGASAGDLQSWAERALAAVEASLLAEAPSWALRYQVANRALEHYTLKERLGLRDQLRSEIAGAKTGTFSQPVHVAFLNRISNP